MRVDLLEELVNEGTNDRELGNMKLSLKTTTEVQMVMLQTLHANATQEEPCPHCIVQEFIAGLLLALGREVVNEVMEEALRIHTLLAGVLEPDRETAMLDAIKALADVDTGKVH